VGEGRKGRRQSQADIFGNYGNYGIGPLGVSLGRIDVRCRSLKERGSFFGEGSRPRDQWFAEPTADQVERLAILTMQTLSRRARTRALPTLFLSQP
jgi:hypothetical protein